jgi:hypothetical protein
MNFPLRHKFSIKITYFSQKTFRISIRARYTTLCDKVCHWLVTGRWFSLGPLVSSTYKTDRYNITEILLTVALNTIGHRTIKQTPMRGVLDTTLCDKVCQWLAAVIIWLSVKICVFIKDWKLIYSELFILKRKSMDNFS